MLLEKDFLCSYIPTVVVFTTLYASYTTKTPKLCFDRLSGRGQIEGAEKVLYAADYLCFVLRYDYII